MDISVKEMNRVDLVEVSGRVDSSNASELGEALNGRINAGTRNLVIDMSGVEYVSSAGLRELVGALKTLKKTGGDLRLAALNERVIEVMEMAGLHSIFEVYESPVEAVGSF